MTSPTVRWFGAFTVIAAAAMLFPGDLGAQVAARSFEELPSILKVGQTLVVTDASGRQTKGRLMDVSPFALVVTTPDARTFAAGTVAEIRLPDSLLSGTLIGAAAGAGLAAWDYWIDPSEPGNGAITVAAIGLGGAIGAGVDALRTGGRVLYRSPQQRSKPTLSPLLGKDRQGVLVTVRF